MLIYSSEENPNKTREGRKINIFLDMYYTERLGVLEPLFQILNCQDC